MVPQWRVATYRRKGTAWVNHIVYRPSEAVTLNFRPSEGDQEESCRQSSEPLTINDPLVIKQKAPIFQKHIY